MKPPLPADAHDAGSSQRQAPSPEVTPGKELPAPHRCVHTRADTHADACFQILRKS